MQDSLDKDDTFDRVRDKSHFNAHKKLCGAVHKIIAKSIAENERISSLKVWD